MATPKQKQDAAERYKNDERVPIRSRLQFAAACGWDSAVVPGSIATAIVSAVASVGMHIHMTGEIDKVQTQIDAIPPAIYDLGERLHEALPAGERTAQQDNLRRAAKSVLAQGPEDIRNLTLVFATTGNGVTLRSDRTEPLERMVEPVALGRKFREVHSEYRDMMTEQKNDIDGIMAFLTASLGLMAWRAKALSDRRAQIPLDHYGIK